MKLTKADREMFAEFGIAAEDSIPDTAVVRENEFGNFELVAKGNVVAHSTHPSALIRVAERLGIHPLANF